MPAIHAIFPDETVVHVPTWVIDNVSFLRWVESDEAPEKGKISFINGTVWFNNTMEQILHNQIKAAIVEEIRIWSRKHDLGCYYPDGMVYSNLDLDFTTVPDGIFVTSKSITDGTVILDNGILSTKITGSPNMVLEVVTRSSAKKDLSDLKILYFEAGIQEYWLVDSRAKQPSLKILKRGKHDFSEVNPVDGWVRSELLHGFFQLRFDQNKNEFRLDSQTLKT